MANPCSPEEFEKLLNAMLGGKFGETAAESLIVGDPGATSPGGGEVRKKLGFLMNTRTQRAAFGDEFGVRVVDPLLRELLKEEHTVAKAFNEAFDLTKPLMTRGEQYLGMSKDLNDKIARLLESTDLQGRFVGAAGTFTPQEIEVGQALRRLYNKHGVEFNVDPDTWINLYRPLVQKHNQGILRDAPDSPHLELFRSRLKSQDELVFYHELERTGNMVDPDPGFVAGFESYMRNGVRAKLLKPFIDQLEADVVNPFFNVRFVNSSHGRSVLVNDEAGYKMWRELKSTILGGTGPGDVVLTHSLRKLTNLFGKDVDTRALYKVTSTLSSLYYGGALGSPLGGRPASIFRQLGQIVPTISELGFKHTGVGIKEALDPKNIAKLRDLGIISSPYENLLERVSVARGAGRIVHEATETMLKVFSATDQFLRVITATGSGSKFDEFMAAGKIAKLPARREFKEEMTRLIQQGKTDEARTRYMFENVANLQYIYGRANRPAVLRGALGNLLAMFTTFPLNTMELFRSFGKRALPESVGGSGDPRPLARLMLLTSGIMYGGAEFLNADLSSFTLLQASMPFSLPAAKAGVDTFKAGRSTVEWAMGNVYTTGETDFHKAERQKAYGEVLRDLRPFVPGGLFFFDDIPKVLDERNMAWFFGLTPLAEERNVLAKERTRETRKRKLEEEGGARTIKGIEPIR